MGLSAARIVVFACAALVGLCASAAAGEMLRFVPQLALTDLRPQRVAFAPDDPTLLMSVSDNGRIDIFDISNPDRPLKITEIWAGANDAAFAPKRTALQKVRIVSGNRDGTVRLWTLDGKAAAEPFKGHSSEALRVAFSPDGTRIVSG